MFNNQELQHDLKMLGLKTKQHEDKIRTLRIEKNRLDDSILDKLVTLAKYDSFSAPRTGSEDLSHRKSDEEIIENILRHNNSAAGIYLRLKTLHSGQACNCLLTKDLIGIVAMLAKVDDDNVSRLLSEYLGLDTMLTVVCKTWDGVKAFESFANECSLNESSGLHGLGAASGRPLDGRFAVICLESLIPYVGEFFADDPQNRLDLRKPRLPSGESPPGFVGFAVNLIGLDTMNVCCMTPNAQGLRETLFYSLFSRVQVYRTRADMLQALPCISDGAISLDGGMIKARTFVLGKRGNVDVKFPKGSVMSSQPASYIETEIQMKHMKWEVERLVEDIKREEALLVHAKSEYGKKRQELVMFWELHGTQLRINSFAAVVRSGSEKLTPVQSTLKF